LEKRKHKRWHLTKPLKIVDRQSNTYLGSIRDIALGGLGIVSKRPLEPDNNIKLKIDLSHENVDMEEIDLRGKNVWCEEKLVDRYFAGIELEDLDNDTRNKIKDIIHRYGFTAQNFTA